MRITASQVLLSASMVLIATGIANAAPDKIGAIGDSISTAFDADDDCDTLISCVGNIGEDRAFSWSTGYTLSDSMRNQLGFNATVEVQENGARWDDAPGQAQAIVAAGGADTVTIELGGNDVCRDVDATLPTKAEIAALIDQTFGLLINAPAEQRPSRILIAEVPNVIQLFETLRDQKNFAFETCQDLWDLDTDKLDVNTCDWGFFDFVCDFFDNVIEDYVSPLTDVLLAAFDVEFPCGFVLNSASNDEQRALALALNIDINDAIAEAVAQWNGANDVEVVLADNIFEFQFTAGDVSQIDCFHPNRQGQTNLARSVLISTGLGDAQPLTEDSQAPVMLAEPSSSAWWVGEGSFRDIYFNFYTDEESSIEVWTYNCNYDKWFYEGTTNETPTEHEFHMEGFNYKYYWQTHVRPSDRSTNSGNWYSTGCI